MKILGNIIWVLFGGFFVALEYFVSSIGLFITIIGIPFGIQTLKLGVLALWPFGSQVVDIPQSSGCLSFLMNVIWFFIGGIWIFLSHLLFGVIFFLTDINDFAAINAIYAQYFQGEAPARSCVAVAALPKGGAFEVEAVAVK